MSKSAHGAGASHERKDRTPRVHPVRERFGNMLPEIGNMQKAHGSTGAHHH